MSENSKLWNNNSNISNQQAFGLGMAGIGSIVGNILMVNSIRHNTSSALSQMRENAKTNSKQVTDLMSNNALSYLKNGVGLSGSALSVINQNAERGLSQIENELSYSRKQLRDNLNSVRNQTFMSLISSASNIGTTLMGLL